MVNAVQKREIDFVVAICDDDKIVSQSLAKIVGDIFKQHKKRVKIIQFYDGPSLLNEIDSINLVFLDIDMPKFDGFYIGKKIKLVNPDCTIIMETGRDDCFKEAFKISALRYITKPYDRIEISEAIQAYLGAKHGENYVDAFFNRNLFKVKEKDILYIRAMDSYSEVVVQNHIFRTEKSMANLEKELDDSMFFRIHKQYIVNISAIEKYSKESVVIQGKELSISRRKKAEFERKYLEYDLKYR